MKNSKLIILLALGALAPAGCSSVKTHVDTGPIKANTFSFINTGSKPAPAGADNTAALHALVQDDITRTLASKGLSRLPTGGDVTVGYLIIAGNNVSTTALGEYFGYNSDADSLADKVHTSETIKSDRRDYFEAGTLVIDIIDPKTNKLLWRNSVQRDILRNLAPEARAARLKEAVDNCLSGVRIER